MGAGRSGGIPPVPGRVWVGESEIRRPDRANPVFSLLLVANRPTDRVMGRVGPAGFHRVRVDWIGPVPITAFHCQKNEVNIIVFCRA
jgi:hypothetical protein